MSRYLVEYKLCYSEILIHSHRKYYTVCATDTTKIKVDVSVCYIHISQKETVAKILNYSRKAHTEFATRFTRRDASVGPCDCIVYADTRSSRGKPPLVQNEYADDHLRKFRNKNENIHSDGISSESPRFTHLTLSNIYLSEAMRDDSIEFYSYSYSTFKKSTI